MDSDYQSCERIRVALEGFEDVTEIEAFVRSYGTGPKIPGTCIVWALNRSEAPLILTFRRPAPFHRLCARRSVPYGQDRSGCPVSKGNEQIRNVFAD